MADLKERGHKAADVNAEVDSGDVDMALLKIHGVTDSEYIGAGGKG